MVNFFPGVKSSQAGALAPHRNASRVAAEMKTGTFQPAASARKPLTWS